jgi:hypothetical protein
VNTTPCRLCGNDRATEVRVSLARWRYPEGAAYDAVPRCVDRKTCRERCEAEGELWPVLDPDEVSLLPGGIG